MQTWTEKFPISSFPLPSTKRFKEKPIPPRGPSDEELLPSHNSLPATPPNGQVCSARGPFSDALSQLWILPAVSGMPDTNTCVCLPNGHGQKCPWGMGLALLSSSPSRVLPGPMHFQLLNPPHHDLGSRTSACRAQVPSRGVADVWERQHPGKDLQ